MGLIYAHMKGKTYSHDKEKALYGKCIDPSSIHKKYICVN
jgi:hypothetical protein